MTRGDHGEHVFRIRDDHIQNVGCLSSKHFIESIRNFILGRDATGGDIEPLGDSNKIRIDTLRVAGIADEGVTSITGIESVSRKWKVGRIWL